MPGSIERLSWIARWKLAALFNRDRYRPYPIRDYQFHVNISESLMAWQCAQGIYDAAKLHALNQTLQPGSCFVDVGASLGYFSLFAASLVGPRGQVLAVEPEPSNIGWLQASVEASDFDRIRVIQGAASDLEGQATLHLGKKSGWHTLTAGQRNRDAGEVEVETFTLDKLTRDLDRVDAIKIDVEGHEHRVLAGALETLQRHKPIILLDLHPQLDADLGELERLLAQAGYQWYAMDEPGSPLDSLPDQPSEVVCRPG